jgi:hypothetical protein
MLEVSNGLLLLPQLLLLAAAKRIRVTGAGKLMALDAPFTLDYHQK